ncbi:MAG: DNA-3-methyladenine glycosylase family protein [Gemmatimonadales bacterium]
MRLPAHFQPTRALAFLGARAVPGLEWVADGWYGRVVESGGQHHWIEARFSSDGTRLTTTSRGTLRAPARHGMVRRIFDLDTDLAPFLGRARGDRVLGPLVRRRPGLRRLLLLDPFEAAVRAVVGQLISVSAATTIVTRIVTSYGPRATERADARAFPSADRLLDAGRRLASVGLTRTKAATILTLARLTTRDNRFWPQLAAEPERADSTLRDLPGIGPWTSAYIRYRGLGDPDAFPGTDLGIVRALESRGVARDRIDRVAERWRPWRALAVPHLWASLGPP